MPPARCCAPAHTNVHLCQPQNGQQRAEGLACPADARWHAPEQARTSQCTTRLPHNTPLLQEVPDAVRVWPAVSDRRAGGLREEGHSQQHSLLPLPPNNLPTLLAGQLHKGQAKWFCVCDASAVGRAPAAHAAHLCCPSAYARAFNATPSPPRPSRAVCAV